MREWGWTELLKTKKYLLPEVVRQFYFFVVDKKYDDKGVAIGPNDFLELPTKLFNKDFVVSVEMLDAMIGVNLSEGQRALPKMSEIEKNEFLKVIFKKDDIEKFPLELVKISNLDVPERILHYVVAQSLLARKRASEITDLDIFCMARIMKKEPFNLSAFIILKMQEACVRVRGEKPFYCPFGKLITVLCESLFEEGQLRNMEKLEDRTGDALQENIKLMRFDFEGLRRISPGFEELDDSIALALRGGGGLKRRKGVRPLFKGVPGVKFSTFRADEQREEVNEEEEEEEEVERVQEPNVGGSGVTNEMIMNTMVQRFDRIDAWREEVDIWRGIVYSRLQSMEDLHYGRRFDGSGPSNRGDDSMDP